DFCAGPHREAGQIIKLVPARGDGIMQIWNHVRRAVAPALFVGLLPTAALAVIPTTVNCPVDSIQSAIDSGFDEITVNGICNENVFIRLDDITIQGGGSGTIEGQVWIDGARRITIQDLKITGGPEHGIVAVNGATVTGKNLVIDHVPNVGVILQTSSAVSLDNVNIQ